MEVRLALRDQGLPVHLALGIDLELRKSEVGGSHDAFCADFVDDDCDRVVVAEHLIALHALLPAHFFEVEFACLLELAEVVVGLHVLEVRGGLHDALRHVAVRSRLGLDLLRLKDGGVGCEAE